MKYRGYLLLTALAIVIFSFTPDKKRKITLPLENHVGHIQWVKETPYQAIKNRRGLIVKGALIPNVETWTYDEYGDEIEHDIYDTGSKPARKCSHQYYPNGDVKEIIKDSDKMVQIGPIPEHPAGWHGTDPPYLKRVLTTYDFKYLNRYDAKGNLLYSSGNYRLTYGATSCKFVYDANSNLMEEYLFSDDTLHPQDAFFFWYDEKGQVTKEVLARRTRLPDYTINLQPDRRTVYQYNSNGKVVDKALYGLHIGLEQDEHTKYDNSGDTLEIVRTDYAFDGRTNTNPVNGRLVKEFFKKPHLSYEDVYAANGKLTDSTISHFDLKNQLSDMEQVHITYSSKGTGDTVMVHRLVNDSHFNIIEDDYNGLDGKSSTKNTWQYKYDSVGNWVEKISITNGTPNQITEREIHYFPNH
jgi:hypothetical protein